MPGFLLTRGGSCSPSLCTFLLGQVLFVLLCTQGMWHSPARDSLTWPTCLDWSVTHLGLHLGQVWVSEPHLALFWGVRLGWWPCASAGAVSWL